MRAASIGTHWRLISVGDGKHRLESPSGETLAWVRGHAVGIAGFDSVGDALASAPMLHRVVDGVLRREYSAWTSPVAPLGELTLVHDGAYEWIATGSTPVARLHRPGTLHVPNEAAARSHALEFVLPSYVSEAAILAVARAMTAAHSSLGDCFEPANMPADATGL
jgi:hypothetical protein